MRKRLFLLFLFLVSILTQTVAANYYVSVSGNDANKGTTPRNPWRTLARINQQAFSAGDTIYLRGGDVFAGNLVFGADDKGTDRHPIVITCSGRKPATINAGSRTGILLRDTEGFVVQNLIVTGSGRTANRGSGIKCINTLPGNATLRSIRIENVEASGFSDEGIFVGGDAADKSQSGYENVRITGCNAHDNGYYGIYVTGVWDSTATTYANKDVEITHCQAYNNSGDPEFLENHSGSGILLDDVDGGKIEHCIAYNNGFLCNATVGGPIGIWAHAANRVIIQFCKSFNNHTGKGNDGGGFDFDGGVTRSIMQYNYSSNNDGAGYLLYVYQGSPHSFHSNIVRYNISVDDGRKNGFGAIHVANDGSGVSNLEIYHNTVVVSPSPTGKPKALLVANTENVRLYNNLFISSGQVPLAEISARQKGLQLLGNNYWNTEGNLIFNEAGNAYTGLVQWSKAAGREMQNGQLKGLSLDPRTDDQPVLPVSADIKSVPVLKIYPLRPDSPLLDAGVNLSHLLKLGLPRQDYAGNPVPQGKGPDIGAHEFAGKNGSIIHSPAKK